jgi:hypothetical protein
MDPLSVGASIIGIAAAASKLASILHELPEAVRLAKDCREELESISLITKSLRRYIIDANDTDFSPQSRHIHLESLVTTLTGCVTTLSKLESMLQKVKVDKQVLGVFDKVYWKRKEAEVRQQHQKLQSYKSSLGLMLSILQR